MHLNITKYQKNEIYIAQKYIMNISYINIKFILTIISIIFFTGCIGLMKSRESFVTAMNFNVGKYIDHVSLPDPVKITHIDDEHDRIEYEYVDTGCKWYYIVENKTKKILFWDYISDSDLCYHKIVIAQ